jgi:hypothetical protein
VPRRQKKKPGDGVAFGRVELVRLIRAFHDSFVRRATHTVRQDAAKQLWLGNRRAGEVICRKKATIAGKYRLRALQCEEVAAQTRDSYAKDMLAVSAREFTEAARQIQDGEL